MLPERKKLHILIYMLLRKLNCCIIKHERNELLASDQTPVDKISDFLKQQLYRGQR